MASAQINLTKNVWTKVTTTDKNGSIRHHSGGTQVVYLESATTPPAFGPVTPTMEETRVGDDWPYWGVDAEDFVWALAVSSDAVIVVSPKGA